MKKLLWIVPLALSFIVAGCGGGSADEQPVDTGVQGGSAGKGGPASQGAPAAGLNPNAANPDAHVGSRAGG